MSGQDTSNKIDNSKNNFIIPHKEYIEKNFHGFVKNVILYKNAQKFDCVAKAVERKTKQVNVTAIRDYNNIWLKHILDSLMILNVEDVYELFFYEEFKGLDIGTGGGFPGVPLAIAREIILKNKSDSLDRFKQAMTLGAGSDFYDSIDRLQQSEVVKDMPNVVVKEAELKAQKVPTDISMGLNRSDNSEFSGKTLINLDDLIDYNGFVLVDSRKKKVKVVSEILKECEVWGATALWSRVEDLGETYYENFHLITARAVAPLPDLIDLSFPYLAKNGLMAFYKLDGTDELENSTEKIKKLGLKLIKEYKYELGETNRVIYVLEKR